MTRKMTDLQICVLIAETESLYCDAAEAIADQATLGFVRDIVRYHQQGNDPTPEDIQALVPLDPTLRWRIFANLRLWADDAAWIDTAINPDITNPKSSATWTLHKYPEMACEYAVEQILETLDQRHPNRS